MTAQAEINAKPGTVQVVLKAWCTARSIELNPKLPESQVDWEPIAQAALGWWNEKVAQLEGDATETDLAEAVVAKMRAHEVWGRILRRRAQ
jgi:DNA-binding protein YbaB